MTDLNIIRLGTRSSALARWQANWVADQLRNVPGVQVELVPISTQGDRQQQGSIGSLGTQGVFTKEIQQALLDRRIDLAVHSLKDLPTDPVPGLSLAAVPERAPVGDVLLSRRGLAFHDLPHAAVVGTGSLRRRAQLLHVRPDLKMADLRGNVDTRIKKLHDGEYEAIVLAEAGIARLELTQHITQHLPLSLMLPAIGQGALGLEIRADHAELHELLTAQLNHPATHAAVLAERSLLFTLRGGCLAPVAAWGRLSTEGDLHLTGLVLSVDGQTRLEESATSSPADAADLGQHVAQSLISRGAPALIASSRGA